MVDFEVDVNADGGVAPTGASDFHVDGPGGPVNRGANVARWRGALTAAALVAVGAVGGGCGNPTQSTSRCIGPPDGALEDIEAQLTTDGELRNGSLVQPEDGQFSLLSAEVHRRDDEPHDKGDIATWAIDDTGTYVAVDVVARDVSAWPDAPFTVSADGAVESRACTDVNRGKTPAQVECERDVASGDDVALPANTDCSDL